MPDTAVVESVRKYLFRDAEKTVYAVLDGASVPDLPQTLWERDPEHVCLYRGELEPDMAEVAPYLVKLEPGSPCTDWVSKEGWGNHWGIFAMIPAEVDIRTVRQHFRRFLVVTDPEGKPLYFRYYDPRVLSVYLPTCNPEEIKIVFGPISSYVVEDEDGSVLLRFSSDEGSLRTERIPLEQP